jgi:lipopolysaccharide transport system permease protein
MAVQVVAIGFVFGLIFAAPLDEFLPFLAVSLVLWAFLSGSVTDGSTSFIAGEAIIRQLALPIWVHVLRSVWKNLIVLFHNASILPVVFLIFWKPISFNLFLFIPGIILNLLFLSSLALVLGVFTTRYRDVQQILVSVMAVAFYVTPVIWQPSLLPPGIAHLLLGLNPLYHFLQVLRLPILGTTPTLENWLVASGATIAMLLFASWVAKRFRHRLAYWI